MLLHRKGMNEVTFCILPITVFVQVTRGQAMAQIARARNRSPSVSVPFSAAQLRLNEESSIKLERCFISSSFWGVGEGTV